ncbi:protein odr-4 homolog [Hyposmocoma kahamanoa]|uniref:protein odr-4 homolog n=1 Tax=Hyposmocoma kahamanoa TaxID=1477025 RepID=UPI000E6D8B31|nr:protein odr-4 homolog [Hyposmocoma kahamanoa]
MVRTVYSPEYCLQYLEQNANNEIFSLGLILGQIIDARESVIHLARTPEEKILDSGSETSYSQDKNDDHGNLIGISEAWVADHAKHVTRMLPGGIIAISFSGIFVICEEDVFDEPNLFGKIKLILNYVYKSLSTNPYMYGNCPNTNDRLVLHMSTSTKVLKCKSVEVGTSKFAITPVEWKFLPKSQQWQRLDCYYEFDEVYPVVVKKSGISVKQQFQQILESAHKTIQSSVMFIDGELKDGTESLDLLVKKKKTKTGSKTTQHTHDGSKSMQVSLFVPFENSLPESVEYMECDGSIHFSGVVSSSIFMFPKATVAEAITAVKEDIIRSLASRFTMHCDALIDDNLLPEEKVCFNEPPRRVLVPVGPLYLCDYLFPGETPAEALLSVRELLDLKITEADVVCDVETPADTSEFDALDRDASSEELLATPQEASQFMYITGICFAMLVLIVSIIVHYYDAIVEFVGKIISKH